MIKKKKDKDISSEIRYIDIKKTEVTGYENHEGKTFHGNKITVDNTQRDKEPRAHKKSGL